VSKPCQDRFLHPILVHYRKIRKIQVAKWGTPKKKNFNETFIIFLVFVFLILTLVYHKTGGKTHKKKHFTSFIPKLMFLVLTVLNFFESEISQICQLLMSRF
jgi:hypothetical protein